MATSGTIYGSCYDGNDAYTSKYSTWIYWKRNWVSVEGNYSYITVYVRVQRTDGYSDSARNLDKLPIVTLKFFDQQITPTVSHVDTRNGAVCTLATWTGAVTHADNGVLNLALSCSWVMTGSSSLRSGSISGTAYLDTIPRASTVTATDANIESATTISITRAASGFTHTITYAFGTLSGTIAEKTDSTSIGWTVPAEFYAQIPNDPSGECVITCDTYSGDSKIGTKDTKFMAIASKERCSPGVGMMAVDVNQESIALTGHAQTIVSGISKLRVLTTANAKNGATIKTISAYCGGIQKTGADVTFDGADSAEVYVIVTDSRGYSTRTDASALSLVSYIAPTIIPTITRDTPTGDTVSVSVRGKWYNGSFGAVSNTIRVTVRRKAASDQDYHTLEEVPVTFNGNDYSGTVTLSGIRYTEPYSFLVRLDDAVFTDANGYRDAKYATVPLSKGIPVFDWGENDFQFNVPVIVDGTLTIGGTTITEAQLTQLLSLIQ